MPSLAVATFACLLVSSAADLPKVVHMNADQLENLGVKPGASGGGIKKTPISIHSNETEIDRDMRVAVMLPGDETDPVAKLLEQGASVYAHDANGQTPGC
jgi:hypothetical protein